VGVADDHPLDAALPIEEDADLPAGLPRELGEVPGELGADDLLGGNLPPVGRFESFDLARLEAEGVTEYVANGASPFGSR
jgi:hypothetical protein